MMSRAVNMDETSGAVNYGLDASWEQMKTASVREKEVFEKSPEPKRSVSWHSTDESDESDILLSTLLGEKTFLDVNSFSKGGFTWLQEDVCDKRSDEERIVEENEESLQELQLDLKQILEKLEELSNLNFNGDNESGGNASNAKKVNVHTVVEVDSLLVNLIAGIEELLKI